MNPPAARHAVDLALVEDCLAGKNEAWATLRGQHHPLLRGVLMSRGASETEAEDVLADLWSDTILRSADRGMLERYDGSYSLRCWFSSIATHRLVDLKRRGKFRAELPTQPMESERDAFDLLPMASVQQADEGLLNLMREALHAALQKVDCEARLFLKLVYIEGITQRELSSIWGCDESRVSRRLKAAMEEIADATLVFVRKRDPYLSLTWADFLDLCQITPDAILG